MDQTSPKT